MSVRVSGVGNIKFTLDNESVPYNPLSSRFIVISRIDRADIPDYAKEAWDEWSDLERFSAALRLDPIEIENILPYVGGPERFVKRVFIDESPSEEDDSPARSIFRVELNGNAGRTLPYGALSSGEQSYVLIELGVALAKFSSHYSPTVLILDILSSLDKIGQKEWAEYLSAPEHLFQTVIELRASLQNVPVSPSISSQIVLFSGRPPHVEIRQVGDYQ